MPKMRSLSARAASQFTRPRLQVGLCSIILGAIAALGFQPFGFWPLTILAVAAFLEIGSRAGSRMSAFWRGWLFGLGHFTAGNAWIATAFTYQGDMPQSLGGVAVVLLSLYLALFPAFTAMATWQFTTSLRRKRMVGRRLPWFGLSFAAFWIVTEWLRSWLFSGFAWNPLGIALLGSFESPGIAYVTKWVGTYGLSGLLVAIAALLRIAVRDGLQASGSKRIVTPIAAIGVTAVLVGMMVFPAVPHTLPNQGVPFTLVQPDVRQEVLNDPHHYESNFQKTANLSLPLDRGIKRVVFWPESGVPDYLRDGYPRYYYKLNNYGADPSVARARIARVIGPQSLLLTGAVDLVMENGDDVAARNVVTAIDGRGKLVAGYAKAHLVPYGEYLPMRNLLEPIGLTRLVPGTMDFWPGPGPRTLDFGPLGKAGMQICYEIIFSGQVIDPNNRPDYIFNPSNDGWFGELGPPQHLAQARLRAIEEGLPVLRATTTGISAVIDADGIVRDYIPHHQAGRMDGVIPPAHAPTVFSRYGNALPLGLAILILLFCTVALRRPER